MRSYTTPIVGIIPLVAFTLAPIACGEADESMPESTPYQQTNFAGKSCGAGKFYCDRICVSVNLLCNDIRDCNDVDDEDGCPTPEDDEVECDSDEFYCDDLCMPTELLCNGVRNCGQFDEEAGCPGPPPPVCGDAVCEGSENRLNCEDCNDGCEPGTQLCLGACIPNDRVCCGLSTTDPNEAIYCADNQRCVANGAAEHGWECACPSGEKYCNGECIQEEYDCCDRADEPRWCTEGECKPDQEAAEGFSCYCPRGEKWCDHLCIPFDASCCGEGSGGLYCNEGTCAADSSASEGYSCQEPRGVCVYYESMATNCGGNDPGEWVCTNRSYTVEECKNIYDDSYVSAGSCYWRYYLSQHRIYEGTCSEAMAGLQ